MDYSEYVTQLLRALILLFTDTEPGVLAEAWAALNSVTISSGRGNKRGEEDVEGCDGDGTRVLFYNLTATISGKLYLLLRVILFR